MTGLIALRHSIFVRIVLWAIFTAAIITFALWVLTISTIERTNRMAMERAVDVDLAGMVDIYASGGIEELSRRIKDRLALHPRDGNPPHYMVASANGTRIAGDITQWPDLRAGTSEAGDMLLHGNVKAFGHTTQLGPDVRLLVAHEYRDIYGLINQISLTFLSGGVLAVVTVALGGWIAAHRLAGRIERINAAFRSHDGALLKQIDAEGHDEIHELTHHAANTLDRLERLASAYRETTDHVAHEIRTPLMHLDNRLVRALSTAPEPDTAISIGDARTEIRGIIRMLESLLDIAASEARRGDHYGLVPVDLSAVAVRLGDLYAYSAEESGHQLKVDIEPGVIINGEEMALTRLITNLLDNAFKFVPAGGTVWLTLSKGPHLGVSDDGPGIEEEQRDRIFEKFDRGGRPPMTEGTGLGLALCRAIAERHRLAIKLESSNKGARFTVAPETKR